MAERIATNKTIPIQNAGQAMLLFRLVPSFPRIPYEIHLCIIAQLINLPKKARRKEGAEAARPQRTLSSPIPDSPHGEVPLWSA